MMELNIVWFRRDLRVHDHAALAAAAAAGGRLVPLYIFDPRYWHRPDTSARQFDFLVESLADLDRALRQRGSELCLRSGTPTEVLSRLHAQHGIASLHFHSRNGTESAEDRNVRTWALKAGVPLREHAMDLPPARPDFDWHDAWEQRMRHPRLPAPDSLPPLSLKSEDWPMASDFGLAEQDCPGRQTGGRTNAILLLRKFLAGAGRNAAKSNLSIMARDAAASHLSAHLAVGSVSEREVWQGAMKARSALLADGDETFASALSAFCEKLALRARIHQSASRAGTTPATALPEDTHGRAGAAVPDARLMAWANGGTGFPLLDASMRCLIATGQLDGRLRSLLLSFATCHLWLAPEQPGRHMAQLCTDFEPDMFYGNARAVIGISHDMPAYIPNPVRQSLARDPDGAFIRKWVPELAGLPDPYLHCPWEAPKSVLSAHGIVLGQSYPMRLVDHVAAAREARRRLAPRPASRPLPFNKATPRTPVGGARAGRRNLPAHGHRAGPVQLSFDLQVPA